MILYIYDFIYLDIYYILRLLDNSWPEARQPGCKRTTNGDHGTWSRDGPRGPWKGL